MEREKKVIHAATYLQKYLANNKYLVALVLGSGLGGFIRDLKPDIAIPYSQIPHFPLSTIKGHQGCLYFCQLEKSNIIILSGRVHLYEGYSPFEVAFPVRVLGALGIKNIILTNAAGALNPLYDVGSLMLITDRVHPAVAGGYLTMDNNGLLSQFSR
ncbi:purine-nucleoside phosphorylase [Desulfovulcanus sp.]